MEQKTLKQKVLDCDKICGTHVTLLEPVVTEIFGYAGYDYIWIDTEHASPDYKTVLNHIISAKLSNTPTLVRVTMNDPNHVKKILEMGPSGIIFPQIETAEEADAAMKCCLYPPYGKRGLGPLHAIRYGYDDIYEYIKKSKDSLCRFVQIESETAVNNLPEMVKNPYIDGFIIGPMDLSGSINRFGEPYGKENEALINKAVEILKNAGKCVGVSTFAVDPDIIRYWNEHGVNMISTGSDIDYLISSCVENLKNLRKAFEE